MLLDIDLIEKETWEGKPYYEVVVKIHRKLFGIIPFTKKITTLIDLVKYISKRLHCDRLKSNIIIMASRANYIEYDYMKDSKITGIENVLVLTNKDMFYEGELILYTAYKECGVIKRGEDCLCDNIMRIDKEILKNYVKCMVKELISRILISTPILFKDSEKYDLDKYFKEFDIPKSLTK